MNYKMIYITLGRTFTIVAGLMLLPIIVAIIYGENTFLSFIIPMLAFLAIGVPSFFIKTEDKAIYAKEGFVIVSLVWIILSLIGALPFVISGEIPYYIDAFFETVSGFTTTGSTVLQDVEQMSKSVMFWRMFNHWVGGMGVLVFVLCVIPSNDAGVMHVFRAESPGPSVGKLVSKMKFTARILYAIYLVMTVIQIVLLIAGGMPVYDSIINSFSTAGTGGLSNKNLSIAAYNSTYLEMVIAIFMFLFSINFNVYYLILVGSFSKAFKSEELRAYLIITVVATILIAVNLLSQVANFGEALRYSFFQVTSISSTTGFSSTNFDTWPTFSKCILVILMMIGACGGSTGGGLKVSRLVMLCKTGRADIRKMIKPRSVMTVKFENQVIDRNTTRNVRLFLMMWVGIVIVSVLLLSLDGYGDKAPGGGFVTNLTATLSCIGNVGPGLDMVGPLQNYGGFAPLSKIWLSFVMLVGRLEIFPMLILFMPRTYKRNS